MPGSGRLQRYVRHDEVKGNQTPFRNEVIDPQAKGRRKFRRPVQVGANEDEAPDDFKDIRGWFVDNKNQLPRYLFTAVCLALAVYQTVELSKEYVRYPTGVNVLVDEPASMRQALPGLTICDSNK